MEAVVGLMVMILGVSHGVEIYCDGRQEGAECYGALGGTVVLQLMDNASEIFRYQWSYKKQIILDGRLNHVLFNRLENRSFFTPSNGTFRINELSWTDGGNYTLETFKSNGRRSEQRSLQLTIEAVETYCDGRQDGAQCYGALGGTLVLRLMDSASEIYQWSSKNIQILLGRKNTTSNLLEKRSFFTRSNGTIRINKLSRSDGGEYTLVIYNSEGQRTEQRTLQLTIQARVSSVLLVPECLSQEEMKVTCSSEGGDSPQYSWTLDGRPLRTAELLSGNTETNSITLKEKVSGQLVCSARNHVSRMSSCGFTLINCTFINEIYLSRWVLAGNNSLCEPTTTMIPETEASTVDKSLLICGVRTAVVILILIGIVVYFAWKEKKYKMAARRMKEHQESAVVMVEMRSSASEL